jgi:hypothetical protein
MFISERAKRRRRGCGALLLAVVASSAASASPAEAANECQVSYVYTAGSGASAVPQVVQAEVSANQIKAINQGAMRYVINDRDWPVEVEVTTVPSGTKWVQLLTKGARDPQIGDYIGSIQLKQVKCLPGGTGGPGSGSTGGPASSGAAAATGVVGAVSSVAGTGAATAGTAARAVVAAAGAAVSGATIAAAGTGTAVTGATAGAAGAAASSTQAIVSQTFAAVRAIVLPFADQLAAWAADARNVARKTAADFAECPSPAAQAKYNDLTIQRQNAIQTRDVANAAMAQTTHALSTCLAATGNHPACMAEYTLAHARFQQHQSDAAGVIASHDAALAVLRGLRCVSPISGHPVPLVAQP